MPRDENLREDAPRGERADGRPVGEGVDPSAVSGRVGGKPSGAGAGFPTGGAEPGEGETANQPEGKSANQPEEPAGQSGEGRPAAQPDEGSSTAQPGGSAGTPEEGSANQPEDKSAGQPERGSANQSEEEATGQPGDKPSGNPEDGVPGEKSSGEGKPSRKARRQRDDGEPEKARAETEKLRAETESLKAELAGTKDKLLRTAAEFDNYRKRTEREKAATAEYARASAAKPLLPILDNIERSSASEAGSPEYIKGIEMIVKQFRELAGNLGLEPIGEPGERFDPAVHEAVMHVEDESLGENTVAEVLQKGYRLGDTVLRAAMVKVAN